jgi:hypothetical protein
MAVAWLVLLLLSLPAIAAGQEPIVPPPPATGAQIIIDPRTPPPATIPSAPEIIVPVPPLEELRPAKTFDVRPSLGISEEYSDNFSQSREDKVSNFRSAITPGLLVLFDRGFLTGWAGYTPMVFYDTSEDDVGVNHAFIGQIAWQATPRLRLTASDTFAQTDEPARADRLDLRRGREKFTSNLFSLTSDYVVEPYTLQGHYRHSYFSSEDSTTISHMPGVTASVSLARINTLTLGYQYLASETKVDGTPTAESVSLFGTPTEDTTLTGHEVTGTYSREVSRLLTAGVTANYAVREQDRSTDTADFNRKSVSLFINYVLPEKLVVRSNIGVAQLDGDASSDEVLLITNSDLSYYLGRAVFGLRLERGFSETFEQGQNFGVVKTSAVSGSVGYKFTPLLSALVSGTYRENKFTGEGGGSQAGRDDETITATANLTYQISRWLSATLDYTYTDTKSSDALASYVENRVRLTLSASFY